jgi:hypothetical protein
MGGCGWERRMISLRKEEVATEVVDGGGGGGGGGWGAEDGVVGVWSVLMILGRSGTARLARSSGPKRLSRSIFYYLTPLLFSFTYDLIMTCETTPIICELGQCLLIG